MKPYQRGDVVSSKGWKCLPMWLSLGGGDLQPSMVECEQVRVIDVTDDWKYLCTLPVEIMRRVDTALRNAFFYGGV